MRRSILRPPPWARKPVVWLDKPEHYTWALEELVADPFNQRGLYHVELEWIGIAIGLSEPYIVNSRDEIVYAPGLQ